MDNRTLPAAAASSAITGQATRRQGDALTDHLVRQAARAAQALPDGVKQQAFLLGIVVGLNDTEILAQLLATGKLLGVIETPSERTIRLAMLGEPTMRGRRDLTRHFMLSAFLTATAGDDAALAAGIAKERADAQRASGFSFADLAADRAGVRFARGVLDKRIPLGMLAVTFSVPSYMPEVDGLPERISAKDFAAQYGNNGDPRFTKQLKEVDDRIMRLPGYRPAGTAQSR